MSLPKCQLIGSDSNVFSIIGNVCQTLKAAKLPEQAAEFRKLALASHSYDAVLTLAMQYVEIGCVGDEDDDSDDDEDWEDDDLDEDDSDED